MVKLMAKQPLVKIGPLGMSVWSYQRAARNLTGFISLARRGHLCSQRWAVAKLQWKTQASSWRSFHLKTKALKIRQVSQTGISSHILVKLHSGNRSRVLKEEIKKTIPSGAVLTLKNIGKFWSNREEDQKEWILQIIRTITIIKRCTHVKVTGKGC